MRILVVLTAFGQAQPAFEVASVKPQTWTGRGRVGIDLRGNTLDAENVSMNDLVLFAYGLRDVQLSGGPGWADRSHTKLADAELYQVVAKAAGDPPPSMEGFRQLLRTLLADRFQLKVRHVQKDLPVYNLVVGKSGPKFKESPADAEFSSATSPLGKPDARMVTTRMTMPSLAATLSLYAGRPVFDKTGLAGGYDFTLEFAFENTAGSEAADDAPSIFTAVEKQLGLKLESAAAPSDTVVIEHAERHSGN